MRSILTEIYLCHACSDQEIADGNARAGSVPEVRLKAWAHYRGWGGSADAYAQHERVVAGSRDRRQLRLAAEAGERARLAALAELASSEPMAGWSVATVLRWVGMLVAQPAHAPRPGPSSAAPEAEAAAGAAGAAGAVADGTTAQGELGAKRFTSTVQPALQLVLGMTLPKDPERKTEPAPPVLHVQNLHLVKLAFAEFEVNGKQWEVMEGKLLRMVLRGRQLGDIDAMAHTLLSARDEQLRAEEAAAEARVRAEAIEAATGAVRRGVVWCGGRCLLVGGRVWLRFTYVTSVLAKTY
jgi:hypothetical protein